ncbi:hypothetical protein Aperf_G00000113588 [Anoplocephala perfoliata]
MLNRLFYVLAALALAAIECTPVTTVIPTTKPEVQRVGAEELVVMGNEKSMGTFTHVCDDHCHHHLDDVTTSDDNDENDEEDGSNDDYDKNTDKVDNDKKDGKDEDDDDVKQATETSDKPYVADILTLETKQFTTITEKPQFTGKPDSIINSSVEFTSKTEGSDKPDDEKKWVTPPTTLSDKGPKSDES